MSLNPCKQLSKNQYFPHHAETCRHLSFCQAPTYRHLLILSIPFNTLAKHVDGFCLRELCAAFHLREEKSPLNPAASIANPASNSSWPQSDTPGAITAHAATLITKSRMEKSASKSAPQI